MPWKSQLQCNLHGNKSVSAHFSILSWNLGVKYNAFSKPWPQTILADIGAIFKFKYASKYIYIYK